MERKRKKSSIYLYPPHTGFVSDCLSIYWAGTEAYGEGKLGDGASMLKPSRSISLQGGIEVKGRANQAEILNCFLFAVPNRLAGGQ